MRRNVIMLTVTLVVIIGWFTATLLSDNRPVLGLDLQGGTSVVLSPVGKFKPDTLDVAIDIIRNRVDTFGTLEPEITRQGSDIVIDLPGVKDRDKARRVVGQTAELRFRPVLAELPAAGVTASTTTTGPSTTAAPGETTVPSSTTTTTLTPDQAAIQTAVTIDSSIVVEP